MLCFNINLHLLSIQKNFGNYFAIVFYIQFLKVNRGLGIGEELFQEKKVSRSFSYFFKNQFTSTSVPMYHKFIQVWPHYSIRSIYYNLLACAMRVLYTDEMNQLFFFFFQILMCCWCFKLLRFKIYKYKHIFCC